MGVLSVLFSLAVVVQTANECNSTDPVMVVTRKA